MSIENLSGILNFTEDPNKIAIIETKSSTRVTYLELERYSNRIANWLNDLEISIGDRVAISAENSINYISLVIALWKVGAVCVLINKKTSLEQLNYILESSESKILFTNLDLIVPIRIININRFPVFDKNIFYQKSHSNDEAAIIYTSGSTGVPKGVIISHKKHKWMIENKAKIPGAGNMRTLIAAPICHMNGLSNLEVSICSHATAILMPEFDIDQFIESVDKFQANQLSGVPTMFSMLLDHESIDKIDKNRIRNIILGSAPVSEILYNRLKEVFSHSKITVSYGLSEVGPGLFGNHPAGIPTPRLSVGYPISGIEYRIKDGILYVKSPSSMIGYNNLDKNNFTDDGFYVTNDMFSVDKDGFYYFQGRADDMFTCGGNNIFPQNIEKIILDSGMIKESAVIGLPDKYKGHKPYVFIVPKNQSTFDLAALEDHCRKKMSSYEIPRKFWLIDAMPLDNIGKISKKNLIEIASNYITELENE